MLLYGQKRGYSEREQQRMSQGSSHVMVNANGNVIDTTRTKAHQKNNKTGSIESMLLLLFPLPLAPACTGSFTRHRRLGQKTWASWRWTRTFRGPMWSRYYCCELYFCVYCCVSQYRCLPSALYSLLEILLERTCCLSTRLSVYLSVRRSFCLSDGLSFYLFLSLCPPPPPPILYLFLHILPSPVLLFLVPLCLSLCIPLLLSLSMCATV